MNQLLLFLFVFAAWIGLILGIGCISTSNIVFIYMQFTNLHSNKDMSKAKKIIKLIIILLIDLIVIALLISSIVFKGWELAFTATAINFIQTFYFLRI